MQRSLRDIFQNLDRVDSVGDFTQEDLRCIGLAVTPPPVYAGDQTPPTFCLLSDDAATAIDRISALLAWCDGKIVALTGAMHVELRSCVEYLRGYVDAALEARRGAA